MEITLHIYELAAWLGSMFLIGAGCGVLVIVYLALKKERNATGPIITKTETDNSFWI